MKLAEQHKLDVSTHTKRVIQSRYCTEERRGTLVQLTSQGLDDTGQLPETCYEGCWLWGFIAVLLTS